MSIQLERGGVTPMPRGDLGTQSFIKTAHYLPGEIIHRTGEPFGVFLVRRGAVLLYDNDRSGKLRILGLFRPPSLLGDPLTSDPNHQDLNAKALTETEAVTFDHLYLSAILRSPLVSAQLSRALQHDIRYIMERLATTLDQSYEARLARALLDFCGYPPNLSTTETQETLGAYSGMTRENVNKWIKRWQKKGIVLPKQTTSKRFCTTIINPDYLLKLSGE